MLGPETRAKLLANPQAAWVAARLPGPAKELVRSLVDAPRWGNFRRTRPFSDDFGFSRGTPIDRLYIERFLDLHAADVRGEALEVKDSTYTVRFGGSSVTGRHVVDIDRENPHATIVADLGRPGSLPKARFDCAIVTQTVHFIPDAGTACANAWQALVPGGVLLVTVPTITRLDPFVPPETDLWRYTRSGLRELLRRSCPDAELEVRGYGNVLAGISFLMGLCVEELRTEELEVHDPGFEIVACGRARKPASHP
jgi:SAM-dependent methyltransferase